MTKILLRNLFCEPSNGGTDTRRRVRNAAALDHYSSGDQRASFLSNLFIVQPGAKSTKPDVTLLTETIKHTFSIACQYVY